MINLTIVIINWNTLELLRNCLTSVYDNVRDISFEVIVVDNASEDGSQRMVREEFTDVVLLENAKNRGFAAANNQGFEIAKGEYLLLLNSDTIVHKSALQDSVHYLEENPDIGVFGCKILNEDGTRQVSTTQFPGFFNLIILTSGISKIPFLNKLDRYRMSSWDGEDKRDVEVISGCCMFVRKQAFDQVGPLDEDFFFFGEETDWCVRFRKHDWRVHYAPLGEVTHLGGGSVKKLNHKRDLMLSDATIRLNRKHHGHKTALAVYYLLDFFNRSRLIYWSLRNILGPNDTCLERKNHFSGVVKGYAACRPEKGV